MSHAVGFLSGSRSLGFSEVIGEFARSIKEVIDSDRCFTRPKTTCNEFLQKVQAFLDEGGSAAFIIPEISIGTCTLKNVSCLELLYRIFHQDIEGLHFFHWDDLGSKYYQYFTRVFEECLSGMDRRMEEPGLGIQEIVALIQSVHASDPYLSKGKDTGNRILHLMEKFLGAGGDPLTSIQSVKVGHERVDQLTLYELVYLLWKHPYETDLESWDSDDESEDLISTRFSNIVDQCFRVIQQRLDQHSIEDDGFLPLIRCLVEFNTIPQMGQKFLALMGYFVKKKVNPNLQFSKLGINGNVYLNVTCFQVTYLLWKNQGASWTDSQHDEFQQIFECMIEDRRTDLTLKFSERSLTAHHFVNSSNLKFYRAQEGAVKKFYTNGEYEPTEAVIDQLYGHSLEQMTIAHYAVTLNDYRMLDRFLELEPRLLNMTCCVTQGKATVDSQRYLVHSRGQTTRIEDLEGNDQLSGTLSLVLQKPFVDSSPMYIQLIRATNVTLLHLAARVGKEGVLAILGGRHANPSLTDSANRTAQHYMEFSITEGSVVKDRSAQEIYRSLGVVTQYNRSAALPEVNKLFHHDGYDVLYDTSRKVAIFVRQRLRKNTSGETPRTNRTWVVNPAIPEINRATNDDFKYTGFDRGHLAAAEDATGSEEKMAATFRLENAVPQNANINRGAWSRLEAHVRQLALVNDLVEVFSGPLFVPVDQEGERVIHHGVMGNGDVHVPTHFFKVVFIHNRETTKEIYILPNETNTEKKRFSDFRYQESALDFIQKHSGIVFNQWIRK